MILDEEGLSGGPGALAASLVTPKGSQAVDLGPGHVDLLGLGDVVVGAVPGLDDGGLESASVAGKVRHA